MQAEPLISVIVPVYHAGEYLRRCLSSLAQAQPPPDEVIVVADGDSDGSWRIAEEFGARLVRLPQRVGPGRARNAGAQVARGEVLLFIDADVAVRADIVAQVRAALRAEPGIVAVFGSYDDEPAAPGLLSQYRNLLNHYVHQTSSEEAFTFCSSCGAIRKEVFLLLGGFADGWVEDVELGYRLRQAGHRIRLRKSLLVKHLKRFTPLSVVRTDLWQRAVPWTRLILRERRLHDDLNLRPSGRASVMLAMLLAPALGLSCLYPAVLPVAGLLGLGLLRANAPFYRLLLRKHGPLFTVQAIPWHVVHYLCCGVGFLLGTALHLLDPS